MPDGLAGEEDEDGITSKRTNGVKKGNPRRLSKKDRIKIRKIKKI